MSQNPEEWRRSLGERIQQARESRGWTQERLGQRLGRSRAWVSDIETGRGNLNVTDFLELCNVLGEGPLTLLGLDAPADEAVRGLLRQLEEAGEGALRDAALALQVVLKIHRDRH